MQFYAGTCQLQNIQYVLIESVAVALKLLVYRWKEKKKEQLFMNCMAFYIIVRAGFHAELSNFFMTKTKPFESLSYIWHIQI